MPKDASDFMKGLKHVNKEFEDQWLKKFAKGLCEEVSGETARKVLGRSKGNASLFNHREVARWTKDTVDRLDTLFDERKRRRIMTRCACHYPEDRLLRLRAMYKTTKDIDLVQKMLREEFASDLKKQKFSLKLIESILVAGWGTAGIRNGDTLIATKLPFELKKYLKTKGPMDKRYHYCHCPRIRNVLKQSEHGISETYCYCGAGFYKGIWEKILQQPVEVEVLETVLQGSNLCRITVHLPKPQKNVPQTIATGMQSP